MDFHIFVGLPRYLMAHLVGNAKSVLLLGERHRSKHDLGYMNMVYAMDYDGTVKGDNSHRYRTDKSERYMIMPGCRRAVRYIAIS